MNVDAPGSVSNNASAEGLLTQSYPEFVPNLAAEALRQIGGSYALQLGEMASKSGHADADHVTGKMPLNYYFAPA